MPTLLFVYPTLSTVLAEILIRWMWLISSSLFTFEEKFDRFKGFSSTNFNTTRRIAASESPNSVVITTLAWYLFFLVFRPESNLRLLHYRYISIIIYIIYSTFRTENLNYYRFRIADVILQKVTDKFPFLIQIFKVASQL